SGVDKRKDNRTINYRKRLCQRFDTTSRKLGNELSYEEIQEIIELLIEKEIFSRKMYAEHHVLTSERIQKVWLDATKRRKKDLRTLPYFLVEVKDVKPEAKIVVQDVLFQPQNAYNSEQSKEKQSKETPPLTPQGENGEERVAGSPSFDVPGYAYNKKTHNLEGLMLELNQLHIVDPNEINAILRLSDYGRLGGYIFRVIGSTRWSTILAKGKYIIAALRKERCGNS
uniref:Lin1244/Lin1753 domain-containing protein n=3 Tax=Bacteroides cellulosilyticus TaxID=246787 RepID=UPI0032EB35D0